jgi:hypothetical protein
MEETVSTLVSLVDAGSAASSLRLASEPVGLTVETWGPGQKGL